MSPYDPIVYLNLAAALAAEMCETYGYGLVAEALWRILVRFAEVNELEPGTLAACISNEDGSLEIAVVPATFRNNSELVIALYLIHEGVHVVDPQWRKRHVSRIHKAVASAKAELDADAIAIDVGQKWLERLRSLKRFEEADELVHALAFLSDHWTTHRGHFTRSMLELTALAA